MNNAPEKIYIYDQSKDGRYGTWNATELEDTVSYIHADLFPKWLPIESLTDYEDVVLMVNKNGSHVSLDKTSNECIFDATHWMPLPKAPT